MLNIKKNIYSLDTNNKSSQDVISFVHKKMLIISYVKNFKM